MSIIIKISCYHFLFQLYFLTIPQETPPQNEDPIEVTACTYGRVGE